MQTVTCNPNVQTLVQRRGVYRSSMAENPDPVEVLTAYLNANGLQQNEVADRLGIDPKTVNRWVNRHTKLTERKLRRVFMQLQVDGRKYGMPDAVPPADGTISEDDMTEIKARLAAIMHKIGLGDDEWRRFA